MLGSEYGVEVSFAPKITVGKAGSGMHIHMMLEKDGVNMMVENGKLSDIAKKMMAGILDLSKVTYSFRKYNSNFLSAACSSSGGSDKYLLGRQEQIGSDTGFRLDGTGNGHDKGCKSCR